MTVKKSIKRWSAYVTTHSHALDLEPGVFTFSSPKRIALSLKRSAEISKRRKGTPFQSAMSMLNFYINRAGKNLPEERKVILKKAKEELRKLFGKDKLHDLSPAPLLRRGDKGGRSINSQ